MKIGYVRVSTPKQIKDNSIPIQTKALKQQGCRPVFIEQYSGHSLARPRLHKALKELTEASHVHLLEAKNNYKATHKNSLKGFKYQPEDELYCYKLDRLSRNMRDGLNIIHKLIHNHIRVIILKPSKEVIDPSTIQGKMMMDMLLMFADLERDFIKQRMQNGRVGEKGNGGRPTRANAKPKKRKVYESIYNAYITKMNEKNLNPKQYKKNNKYAPARMISIDRGVARTTVIRIYKSLKDVDFPNKIKLNHYTKQAKKHTYSKKPIKMSKSLQRKLELQDKLGSENDDLVMNSQDLSLMKLKNPPLYEKKRKQQSKARKNIRLAMKRTKKELKALDKH